MFGRLYSWKTSRFGVASWSAGVAFASLLAVTSLAADERSGADAEARQKKSNSPTISGEEIFRREWIADDPRSHGGDGLGPVFNESSCVACHNQGAIGGGGPVGKNVQLLTASMPTLEQLKAAIGNPPPSRQPSPSVPAQQTSNKPRESQRAKAIAQVERQLKATRDQLVNWHPGFRKSNTVVLHRFGIDTKHENWRIRAASGIFVSARPSAPTQFRARSGNAIQAPRVPTAAFISPVPAQSGTASVNNSQFPQLQSVAVSQAANSNPFPVVGRISQEIQSLKQQARSDMSSAFSVGISAVQRSQRNTTALFGIGQIDAIPAEAIEAIAKRKHEDFPRISGRVHRMEDGRVGRFGWKAQESTLYDFTMTACAVEVGLHVSDHAQSSVPYKPETKPTGLDLNRDEVNSLVDYLKELPAPVQRKSSHAEVAQRLDDGERLFVEVGCAACHVKKLGDADGLFADLLLHDMGPDLGAVGSYGVPSTPTFDPDAVPLADKDGKNAKPKVVPPSAQEWKTPPLWGVRDSAPYLHDGRAATLDQAIAFHGGEAADSRLRFFMQSPANRMKITAFLKSLVAPDAVAKR
ncbi:MAG: hypothetical protein HON53_02990 [Planctomycetaceae bacterium]|nr:hypothetical protein [Planctomycetaceae bacterium]MBT6155999.1 hypothetical protein [Planctomycetaceae bacterium]MBT6487560.1 hypothetical protein [Planctomycetaceae bacterium]MBT6498124.1 hypothetical protein [Planctomycetaceae bacterium]